MPEVCFHRGHLSENGNEAKEIVMSTRTGMWCIGEFHFKRSQNSGFHPYTVSGLEFLSCISVRPALLFLSDKA
jgi:hypothetical protein